MANSTFLFIANCIYFEYFQIYYTPFYSYTRYAFFTASSKFVSSPKFKIQQIKKY